MRIPASVASIAFLICASSPAPTLAEEAPAEPTPQERLGKLQREFHKLAQEMKKKERALQEDAEVVKAEEAVQAKQADLDKATEALHAKIAAKDPKFKVLFDEIEAQKARLDELEEKRKPFVEEADERRQKANKLWGERNAASKSSMLAMRELQKKAAPHRSDPGLKELQDEVAARQKALREAEDAIYAKIAEKNPEFKELFEKATGLRTKTEEMDAELGKLTAEMSAPMPEDAAAAQQAIQSLRKRLRGWDRAVGAEVDARREDPDLKPLFDATNAKKEVLTQALEARNELMGKKDPEYGEMLKKKTEYKRAFAPFRNKGKNRRAGGD